MGLKRYTDWYGWWIGLRTNLMKCIGTTGIAWLGTNGASAGGVKAAGHLTLVWCNNYDADPAKAANEWTQVYATDGLEKPNWCLIGHTQAGFMVVPMDRPIRFFKVANVFE